MVQRACNTRIVPLNEMKQSNHGHIGMSYTPIVTRDVQICNSSCSHCVCMHCARARMQQPHINDRDVVAPTTHTNRSWKSKGVSQKPKQPRREPEARTAKGRARSRNSQSMGQTPEQPRREPEALTAKERARSRNSQGVSQKPEQQRC